MPRGKRNTPFQPGHGLFYGLRPVSRDPETNAVTSVSCRFCEKFGREEKVGAKRRATQRVKHFKQPFRTENYHQHHQGQHKMRWSEYKVLSAERKVAYLDSPTAPPQDAYSHIENVVNNPAAHSPQPPDPIPTEHQHHPAPLPRLPAFKRPVQVRPLKFFIEKPIVDVIIGDMLFNAVQENSTNERAISAFTTPHESMVDYAVNIKNTKLFHMTVEYVKLGCTPKLATALIAEMAKSSSRANDSMHYMEECSDAKVSAYVRCVIAHNLQGLADLMRASWAFSLSLERTEYLSTIYVDVSIRLCVCDDIQTFHLMSFPAHDRYNLDSMYKSVSCVLDVLCPTWHDKIVGTCTDGSFLAHGASQILADRFRAETSISFIRTWSGAHQLDLVIRSVYRNVLDESFYDTLTKLIAYLRREDNLTAEMKSQCPKVAASSWLSIEKALRWIKTHRIIILQYLDKKKPGWGPSMSWWVLAMALYEFSHTVTKTYVRIRGMTTFVSQQTHHIAELIQSLHRISGCKGPITDDELNLLSEWDLIIDSKYVVQKSAIRNFLSGLGSFVHISMSELPADALNEVIHAVGTMFLSAVVGLSASIENRGELIGGPTGLPPVLPHELIKLTRAAFNGDVRAQARRLSSFFSPSEIEQIEEEFGDFLEAYHREEIFKASLQAIDHCKDFGRAWGVLSVRFKRLYLYCGGIGSVFPGEFSVNPQCTIRPHENEAFRMTGIFDFALEGSLHSEQYSKLRNLLEVVRS